MQIQAYFSGVGSISKRSNREIIQFQVVSVKDLRVIINNFDKYPLIIEGCSDFKLFKQIFNLKERKEHLTDDGLGKIIAIKATMNNGLSSKLQTAFPDVVPVTRPLVKKKNYWCVLISWIHICWRMFQDYYSSKYNLFCWLSSSAYNSK